MLPTVPTSAYLPIKATPLSIKTVLPTVPMLLTMKKAVTLHLQTMLPTLPAKNAKEKRLKN